MTTRAETSQSTSGTMAVKLPIDGGALEGDLALPAGARGIVLFAHGSGSGRHSPRNQFVAASLQERGLGTLLIDLLTPEEEHAERYTRHLRFDIDLLTGRLISAIDWLGSHPQTRDLPVGLFGASTGAAGALAAAAKRPARIGAVVSRGGRPDLAGPYLPLVHCPTLLIVGGLDGPVIGMNEEAKAFMTDARTELVIVPGATHLFEEPGALEEVARLAGEWFGAHLIRGRGQ
jgi:putative phosphoribosyl transferase